MLTVTVQPPRISAALLATRTLEVMCCNEPMRVLVARTGPYVEVTNEALALTITKVIRICWQCKARVTTEVIAP